MSMEMLSIRKDGIKKILFVVLAIMIIANVWASEDEEMQPKDILERFQRIGNSYWD